MQYSQESELSSIQIIFIKVDFQEPEGHIIATYSHSCISKSIQFKTVKTLSQAL